MAKNNEIMPEKNLNTDFIKHTKYIEILKKSKKPDLFSGFFSVIPYLESLEKGVYISLSLTVHAYHNKGKIKSQAAIHKILCRLVP